MVANAPGSQLYLSWGVSCLMAGTVGLALYRGMYVYMRARARSPLIMLVASLGVLLALTAAITIVFQTAARPLPEAFGNEPWTVGGANIKGFNVFTIGVALAGFVALLLVLKLTAFGKAVRAIGDDEEVSKVVGINTTVIIASVFFIGAVYAAMAGILTGHDTAIQPKNGPPAPFERLDCLRGGWHWKPLRRHRRRIHFGNDRAVRHLGPGGGMEGCHILHCSYIVPVVLAQGPAAQKVMG